MEIGFLPKAFLKWFSKGNLNEVHLNILLSNVIIVIAFIALGNNLFSVSSIPHICISRALFHVDCPGCGMTTGLMDFFHFDLGGAYQSNPVSILAGFFFIFQIIIRFTVIVREGLSKQILRISSIANYTLITFLFINFIFKIFIH